MLQKIKNEDERIAKGMRLFVPSILGTSGEKPAWLGRSFKADKNIPLVEKFEAAKHLLGEKGYQLAVALSEEDVKKTKDKSEINRLRDFHNWLVRKYLHDLDEESKKDWLMEHYPDFYKMLFEYVDKTAEMEGEYQRLNIEGPTTIEELAKLYTYEKEILNAPTYSNLSADAFARMITGAEGFKTEAQRVNVQGEPFRRGVYNSRYSKIIAETSNVNIHDAVPGRISYTSAQGPDNYYHDLPVRATDGNLSSVLTLPPTGVSVQKPKP